MKKIIETINLSVHYGQTEALKDVSFAVEQGDFVGLVGPNGGGKTTLAKSVLGLLPVASGKILLFNQAIESFDDFKRIGYLPQKHTGINQLFPASVEEVVLLGILSSKKWPRKINQKDRQRIDELLKSLGISNLKGKLISELSGGQQQKVFLARAIASEPELLILDEPSTALDPNSREQFFAQLKELNSQKKTTIILITHDTGYVGKYANKLLYIDRKLVFFVKIADFCPSGEIESCFEKSDKHIIWHQHK
ncbi:MAG: metal ABC transporter ATP-binding protein [Candidatus Staskawiczbacteria bacterium]|nr:metal ABC transporter ATP-binding protein [Candidatus Staskawiczbacteria bacterium]